MKQQPLQAPASISFAEAIAFTQSLLERLAAGTLDETQEREAIASLVRSENGARGFFVTYLTSERSVVETPSPAAIAALQSSPEIVAEVLVKNVAMSAAMAVFHRRQTNESLAQGSDRVCRRTVNLIQQTQLPQMREKLEALKTSARTGIGNYQDFLQRWEYDEQQRNVIVEAIEKTEKQLE